VEADIPQVAVLHGAVFGLPPSTRQPKPYRPYFTDVFLMNPWRTEAVSSRVYEEADGSITGFLGVVPRRMSMNGQPLLAAICSQFVVHPNSRGLAGLKLLKSVFEGPQDLSLTDEANEMTRTIWEGRGGLTAWPHSVRWFRPLRPWRLAVSWMTQRGWPAPVTLLSRPLARIGEVVTARLARRVFPHAVSDVLGEDLDAATVLRHFPRFAADRMIHPDYDARSLQWLLERAALMKGEGHLQAVAVSDRGRGVLGWYLYYVKAGGIGEVVQIAATADTVDAVLTHLIDHAWRHKLIGLSGRLEPAFIRHFLKHGCILHSRSRYMLVHSKIPAVAQALRSGNVFLSPLDGEWCLRFQEA